MPERNTRTSRADDARPQGGVRGALAGLTAAAAAEADKRKTRSRSRSRATTPSTSTPAPTSERRRSNSRGAVQRAATENDRRQQRESAERTQRTITGFAGDVLDNAIPNWGDEWAGLWGGIGSTIEGRGFRSGYDNQRKRFTESQEQYDRENPNLSWVSTGAGVVTGMALPAARVAKANTRADRARAGALTGAAYGGIAGAGDGESLTERAQNAAIQAPLGAAVGYVAPGIVEDVVKAAPKVANTVREALADEAGELRIPPSLSGALRGAPAKVQPSPMLRGVAADYMKARGETYTPPTNYAQADPERGARVARAYEEMLHAPNDPRVREAYSKLADETMAQYEAARQAGIQFEFNPQGVDPYNDSPWGAIRDINENKHLYVYPTDEGFGTLNELDGNPLMDIVPGLDWNGKPVRVNDIFRGVHDVFGHGKEGVGFRAAGEENAYLQHAAMFSPQARHALASETRGQNSWLNFGPYGETNRTAKVGDTVFADQKTGLLPKWAAEEGTEDFLPREMIDLEHFSHKDGLTELDPSFRGTNPNRGFTPRSDLARGSLTDFGVNTGQPGGYMREAGVGPLAYRASVPKSPMIEVNAPEWQELIDIAKPIVRRAEQRTAAGFRGEKWDGPGNDEWEKYTSILPSSDNGVGLLDGIAKARGYEGILYPTEASNLGSIAKRWRNTPVSRFPDLDAAPKAPEPVLKSAPAPKPVQSKPRAPAILKEELPRAPDFGYPVKHSALRNQPAYDELGVEFEANVPMAERKVISPEDLQGSTLIAGMSDLTRAGGILKGVRGQRFWDPIEMQGGQDFMRTQAAAETGAVWASDKSPMTAMLNKARKAEGDAYLTPFTMGGESGDYSHHMGDAILAHLQSSPKEVRAEFDEVFRKRFPDFKGTERIVYPQHEKELREQLAGKPGMRSALAKALDKARWRDQGMPDIGVLRQAVNDPDLIKAPTESFGYSIGKINKEADTIPGGPVPHNTYSTQLPGEYAGGLEVQVPPNIMFPDYFDEAMARPKVKRENIGYMLKLGAPAQEAHQKWLDGIMKYTEYARSRGDLNWKP